MKTEVCYVCEICCHNSIDREEIVRCEAQGRPNKFKHGQKVKVRIRMGERPVLETKFFLAHISVIRSAVHFAAKTHKVSYSVEFQKEDKPALEKLGKCGTFMGVKYGPSNILYPEEDIRAIV